MLNLGQSYSRKDIWAFLRPGEEYVRGGIWSTGYVIEKDMFLAFINVGVPGKTGHEFPNHYDENTGILTWYGKPNAHSAQPSIKSLLDGRTCFHAFARWDNSNTKFVYLGLCDIESYKDWVDVGGGIVTIKMKLITGYAVSVPSAKGQECQRFKRQVMVEVNRYERNPRYRSECIKAHGTDCYICGFSAEKKYGEIGRDYCHVHHIEPLSEVGGEGELDPAKDLIPVCPNCHSMLHRRRPALKPQELSELINQKSRSVRPQCPK